MINIFIMLGIIFANIIAILLTYHFLKPLDKKERIIFIAVSIAINYIIILGIYALSSLGIDESISKAAKSFITYMFVPVNMILVMPFIANTYCKLKAKSLSNEKLQKRLIIIGIIALVIVVFEIFYFKGIQADIAKLNLIK